MISFRFVRIPFRLHPKRGDHFLPADFTGSIGWTSAREQIQGSISDFPPSISLNVLLPCEMPRWIVQKFSYINVTLIRVQQRTVQALREE